MRYKKDRWFTFVVPAGAILRDCKFLDNDGGVSGAPNPPVAAYEQVVRNAVISANLLGQQGWRLTDLEARFDAFSNLTMEMKGVDARRPPPPDGYANPSAHALPSPANLIQIDRPKKETAHGPDRAPGDQ